MRLTTSGAVVLLIGGVSLLPAAGCRSGSDQGTGGMATAGQTREAIPLPELSHYYLEATAPRHRAVRKPILDEQARHLRILAEKAAELAEQTEGWDSDTRLMSMAEPLRDSARAAVREFRNSLCALSAAAETADLAAVRSEYDRAVASYQNVRGLSGIR